MDETRIQCNKEEGKKASSESFMWVIRSTAGEEIQATFFYYAKSRNGDTAKELLSGYHGYLVTDGYSGYEKVEGIIRNLCWSHYLRTEISRMPDGGLMRRSKPCPKQNRKTAAHTLR